MDGILHISTIAALDGDTFLQFFGRLHPIVVHFPIALTIVALLAELTCIVRRRDGISVLGRELVILAACFAILAAWFGWLNAGFESLNEDERWWAGELRGPAADAARTLFLHRWGGVAVAVLLVLASGFSLIASARGLRRNLYRAVLVIASGVTGLTGHLGGEMVFGEGYLFEVFSTPAPAPLPSTPPGNLDADTPADPTAPPAGADPGDVLAASVTTLFTDRCANCHDTRRRKGGLAVVPLDELTRGDPEYWVIEPGLPEFSELVRRVSLPDADPDRMPPKGPHLTDAEIALISEWIIAGAPSGSPAATPTPESAAPQESTTPPTDDVPPADDVPPTDDVPATVTDPVPVAVVAPVAPPSAEPPVPDAEAIAALNARGGVVAPIAQGSRLLSANLSLARPSMTDADLELLVPLADHVVWLNLSRTAITDAGLGPVASMTRLQRLRLDQTAITDAGLARVRELTSVESLNLFETKVTDAGLLAIGDWPRLARLYVGRTGVTDGAITMLRTLRPGLEVVGELTFAPIETGGPATDDAPPPDPPSDATPDAAASDDGAG
ncbi:MAG: hypothetical protein KDA25_12520 [Phycisphaerales bacterium]|nr:hypothetical protein [Phycisphaerales bacterium]